MRAPGDRRASVGRKEGGGWGGATAGREEWSEVHSREGDRGECVGLGVEG